MKQKNLLRAHSWNNCSLTYSSFNELTALATQPAGTAGIKYVIEGTEHYSIRGQNHFVRSGQYLLVNEKCSFEIDLPHSPKAVRGFCITLSAGLLQDAEHFHAHTPEQLLDHSGGSEPVREFPELIHPTGDELGKLLAGFTTGLDPETGCVAASDEHLFTRIADALLISQGRWNKSTTPLNVQRRSTRIELYRRIAHAKMIMDEAPETVDTIRLLAQEAALSQFHFMRCFRQLYGISPHQYLIRRRLLKASALLTRQLPVSEVALRCGFSDPQAFSKAFQKHYKCAPSRFSRI